VVLDSLHMEESLCDVLNSVSKSGNDAVDFLRFVCARCKWLYENNEGFRPVLEALQRARAIDPVSSAWWAHLDEEHRCLAGDDSMRVKMCEYLCLVSHYEATSFVRGMVTEETCLQGGKHLRQLLGEAFRILGEKRTFCLKMVRPEGFKDK